jgi:hypothetical protein
VILALALSVQADAATGLEWKIPAEGRRYHLLTRINLPEYMLFAAEKNTEVRVSQVALEVVTLCVPTETRKASWRLDCKLEDVSIQALAVPGDNGDLASVVNEYDDRLTGKTVQIDLGANGNIRDVDLEGYPKDLQRTAAIQENLRQLFARAFSTLDLELPKKGDDKGKGFWKQDNLLAVAFPSASGVMGSVKVVHTIDKTEGNLVSWTSKGSGVVFTGEMIAVAGQQRPKNSYNFTYEGKATFDTTDGALVSRDFLAKAIPTAGSMMAEAGGGFPYVQAAAADLVKGPAPTLPPSGLLDGSR